MGDNDYIHSELRQNMCKGLPVLILGKNYWVLIYPIVKKKSQKTLFHSGIVNRFQNYYLVHDYLIRNNQCKGGEIEFVFYYQIFWRVSQKNSAIMCNIFNAQLNSIQKVLFFEKTLQLKLMIFLGWGAWPNGQAWLNGWEFEHDWGESFHNFRFLK